jgi:hypothetical protein
MKILSVIFDETMAEFENKLCKNRPIGFTKQNLLRIRIFGNLPTLRKMAAVGYNVRFRFL